MTKTLLLLSCFALTACADAALSMRMQIVPTRDLVADPASATVIVMKPGAGAANAIFDEAGTAWGEIPTGAKLIVKLPPGDHTLYKAMYKGPGTGDYALFNKVGTICSSVSGNLQAGHIYFVEASVFKLFVVSPKDPRLAQWTTMPNGEMNPTVGPSSVSSDPEWAGCVDGAQKEDKKRSDRAKATFGEGVTAWPAP
jgi:hypothetical protein